MTEHELLTLIQTKMPFVGTVTLDSALVDDLGFDSALLMDLILGIEEHCGCFLPERELTLDHIKTPRRLWHLIERQREGKENA